MSCCGNAHIRESLPINLRKFPSLSGTTSILIIGPENKTEQLQKDIWRIFTNSVLNEETQRLFKSFSIDRKISGDALQAIKENFYHFVIIHPDSEEETPKDIEEKLATEIRRQEKTTHQKTNCVIVMIYQKQYCKQALKTVGRSTSIVNEILPTNFMDTTERTNTRWKLLSYQTEPYLP